ncbi:hypothetical protein AQUSIP_23700 [Aquicella siphonis]|uniref:Uncharacterized protein n=1 Tax=Aquicella siphonis TaxID=254247 RepID=A0A5E4PL50_9COXI|nr:DUF6506 family protein [Aquicella siphonis]VVC77043.1 hypothetical protein AQUSIP_23700 [Aquicella siphonis]
MALRYWAFIYLSPGFNHEKDIDEMKSDQTRVKIIGIDMNHKEHVIEVAKKLVEEGVQCIELCGGFGPVWISQVMEAINHAVPVGGVFYGPEARRPMLDILNSP